MTHRAFRRIQISNIEDTAGTAEAAVEILFGTMAHEEVLTRHLPDEDRNSLARHMADDVDTSEQVNLSYNWDLNAYHAAWLAGAFIKGNCTPTQPDSTNQPNAYLWTYEPSLTAANTPDSFTIEYGDNTQAYETEYCIGTRWVISGAPNGVVTSAMELVGRQRTDTTFTGSLSASTVQRTVFNKAKFYIDTSWAGLHGTQKTGLLCGFTWTFETMLTPFWTADGNLYFSSVAEDKKAPVLELTYKWGSDADTARGLFEAGTTTYISLDLLGNTELDSGQSNPPYVRIDGAYRYRQWPAWDASQGLTTCNVTADAVYDSTGGKMMSMQILTALSSIT